LTPVASGITGAANIPYVSSAATPGTTAIAVGSVAGANGPNFSTGTSNITTLPLPTMVNGTSVSILDASGNTWAAPLLYVSPQGINFTVPPTVAPGLASVTVLSGTQIQTAGNVQISAVAPGLYTLNGTNLAAGDVVRVGANGIQAPGQIYAITSAGSYIANPIQLGAASDHTYLTLFGTGFMSAAAGSVKVTIGGLDAPVLYAGPQKGYAGLDQVNFEIPRALAGKGTVSILMSAGGVASNPVQVLIQ
jgi:uncharacterized protein (TIGR03437 family)